MSETIITKLNKLTPARVHAWIVERLENACRIASTKTGADRDGWLNDAAYLAGASTLLMKAIDAGAKVDPAALRATTAWPAEIGQPEATPQEKLDFLAGECRKALAVLERLSLVDYFQAIADDDPNAKAIEQLGDFLRPALHVLGYPSR